MDTQLALVALSPASVDGADGGGALRVEPQLPSLAFTLMPIDAQMRFRVIVYLHERESCSPSEEALR